MFYAGGYFFAYSDDRILAVNPSTLVLTGESEVVEALGIPWEPGVQQVLASAQISSTVTASVTLQKFDVAETSLALNTLFYAQSATFSFPTAFRVTTPAGSGTVNVSVSGITATSETQLSVTTKGAPQVVASGSYTLGAGVITFPQSLRGQEITGYYQGTLAAGGISIGGPTAAASYAQLGFYGRLLNTEKNAQIWVRQFVPSGSFDLGLIGQAGEDVTVEGTITTPSDWNRPYWITFDA